MTYDKNNIFAKIIRGEIPCKEVFNDGRVLAFHDVNPAAPCHILVIPKGEYKSFADFADKAGAAEAAHFWLVVSEIAEKMGLAKTGYRLITNNGSDASQTVHHFHVHILGGKILGPLIAGDKNH